MFNDFVKLMTFVVSVSWDKTSIKTHRLSVFIRCYTFFIGSADAMNDPRELNYRQSQSSHVAVSVGNHLVNTLYRYKRQSYCVARCHLIDGLSSIMRKDSQLFLCYHKRSFMKYLIHITPNGQISIDDCLVYWRTYASLGLSELYWYFLSEFPRIPWQSTQHQSHLHCADDLRANRRTNNQYSC